MTKLGLDFTPAIYGRGVSRYTINLVDALLKHTSVDLTLYGSSLRQKSELKKIAKKFKTKTAFQNFPPSALSKMWKLGLNPIKKTMPDIEIFHSWDWIQPPDKNLPLVSTIHDLAILRFPETAHPRVERMHHESWKILKERQAEIIAVSHATKKDIIQLLGIPSYQIHVIPEALPLEIAELDKKMTEEQVEIVKERLQLKKPYILFVGTREPRKNLLKLIEAWLPLQKDIQLIVAGDKGWDESEDEKYANLENLRFLGRVSDEELSVLYAEAELFAYPSLYEGFGLPILEAFHHGTPVLTSEVAALIEVAGNAAELIDPESVESIRKGIKKILNEEPDDQKKRLQRMIIRLQMFSWKNVAKQTMEVYNLAIKKFEDRTAEGKN